MTPTSDLERARIARDASVRAWRTFWTAISFDVAATVAAYLVTVIGDFEWTRAYWIAVGLGVAKSIITGVAAYFIRKFIRPANLGASES